MAVTVNSVIASVNRQLNDIENIVWEETLLIEYFNIAVNQIVDQKPNSNVIGESFTLDGDSFDEGGYFTLPERGKYVVDVVSLTVGDKIIAIKLADKERLDKNNPDWLNFKYYPANHSTLGDGLYPITARGASPGYVLDETNSSASYPQKSFSYVYDPKDPKVFYLFPRIDIAGKEGSIVVKLFVRFQQYFSVFANSDTLPANFGEDYQNAIRKWMLYEAYTREDTAITHPAKAAVFREDFYNTLQIQSMKEEEENPNIKETQRI